MKHLWLIRHAKSSWNLPELPDTFRPLNERGYLNAQEMSMRLKKAGVKPDLIISSPAIRAMSTALIFTKNLGCIASSIQIADRLYATTPDDYIEVVSEFPDKAETILLFGHNPLISQTAALLGGTEYVDMPTTGMIHLSFRSESWSECAQRSGKLEMFDFPKNEVR